MRHDLVPRLSAVVRPSGPRRLQAGARSFAELINDAGISPRERLTFTAPNSSGCRGNSRHLATRIPLGDEQ